MERRNESRLARITRSSCLNTAGELDHGSEAFGIVPPYENDTDITGLLVSYNSSIASHWQGTNPPVFIACPVTQSALNESASEWRTLQLSVQLGLPLQFMPFNRQAGWRSKYYPRDPVTGSRFNKLVLLLSLDTDPESNTFGDAAHKLDHDEIAIARSDGQDLNWRHVQVLEAFVLAKFHDLMHYGMSPQDFETALGIDEDTTSSFGDPTLEVTGTALRESFRNRSRPSLELAIVAASKATQANFASFFLKHQAEEMQSDGAGGPWLC